MRSIPQREQFGPHGGRLAKIILCLLLLVLCAMLPGVVFAARAPLLAQDSLFNPGGSPSGTSSDVGWNSWYIEAAITAACFLFISVFCFYVIYQMLLQRNWWPKSAYGVTAALVLVATVAVASVLFWEDLIGTGSFFERWWKLGVLWLVSVMTALLLMAIFKSKKA